MPVNITLSGDSEEESYVRVGSGRTLNAVFGIFKENFVINSAFPMKTDAGGPHA